MHDYPPPQLLIGGEWRSSGDGIANIVRNPANEATLAEVPRAGQRDLDDAIDASRTAFEGWRKTSPQERSALLRKTAQLIRERIPAMAMAMTLEQGKPLAESEAECMASAEAFDWYAGEALRANGRVLPSRVRGTRQLVVSQPVGPVAAFTPWNFPGLLPARKIAPALAAGCTMVMKPSEETPQSAIHLAQALMDAGLPKGVLNLVFGVPEEVSTHLIRSDVIRKVTFTGSTGVGRTLAHLAADGLKPCTLELGGHAPVLIFDDVDLEKTIKACALGKIRNGGQICGSPTRFLVHESIYDRFVRGMADALDAMAVGSGLDRSNQMGPLANARRPAAMEQLVEDARSNGARVAAGGQQKKHDGYFWRPTLLADVPATAMAMNVEPFGPLAMAMRFRTVEEAITEANRLPYGLVASVFTQSAATAMTVSEELQAGGVAVNNFTVAHIEAPFGGVKDSGYGVEGGPEGLEAFMVPKYIHHAH